MPNRTQLPSEDTLRLLTRAGRVALAARAAARVQSLASVENGAKPEDAAAVVDAINAALGAARIGSAVVDGENVLGKAKAIDRAPHRPEYSKQLRSAALAAERAATAAGFLRITVGGDPADLEPVVKSLNATFSAVEYEMESRSRAAMDAAPTPNSRASAGMGAGFARNAAVDKLLECIWRDYDRALAFGEELGLEEESALDPDWLGPLLPGNRAAQWPLGPAMEPDTGGITLTLELPDGTSDEEAERLAIQYIDNLDTLHRALGGHGLRIIPPVECHEPSRVAQGVNS